jgi:hypothetical protein
VSRPILHGQVPAVRVCLAVLIGDKRQSVRLQPHRIAPPRGYRVALIAPTIGALIAVGLGQRISLGRGRSGRDRSAVEQGVGVGQKLIGGACQGLRSGQQLVGRGLKQLFALHRKHLVQLLEGLGLGYGLLEGGGIVLLLLELLLKLAAAVVLIMLRSKLKPWLIACCLADPPDVPGKAAPSPCDVDALKLGAMEHEGWLPH